MNKDYKNKISRKEALKTMGKYAAMTAVGTFMILNPTKGEAQGSATGAGSAPF